MKNRFRKFLSLVFFILVCNKLIFAQDKILYRLSARVSCTIPNPTSNAAFRKSFNGVYELNGSFNYHIFQSIGIGLVVKNGLFSVPMSHLGELNTKAEINNWGGRFSYDHFFSDLTMFSASLNIGKNFTKYTSVICAHPSNDPHKFSENYFEPELNIYFFIEKSLAFGVNISEVIIGNSFDPYAICLNEFQPFSTNELLGITSYLNFGFNVYYGFVERKAKIKY